MKTFVLFYEYVDNMIERRAPHRPAHMAHADKFVTRGEIVMGGPLVEPVDGAIFVFRTDDAVLVETFVKDDPYKNAGLIKAYRVKEWMLVTGGERLESVMARAS
jgi:uncharacterized protein